MRDLVTSLRANGYDFFVGVPGAMREGCVAAGREDAAVGIAAGATMAGRKSAVFMTNSGLGACLEALATLTIVYELPVLLVVNWTGAAQVTPRLLSLVDTPVLVVESNHLEDQVRESVDIARHLRRPVALLVREESR